MPDIDPPPIAKRLRRLMDERGFSIREAAALAGIPHQTVGEILSGTVANPRITTIERIVYAIGGTMAELYEED